MEQIITWDTQLFLFLNNLGSESFDGFWMFVTKQLHWIPLFILVFYLIFKNIKRNELLLLVILLAVLITFVDQSTNLVKFTFERLRPCSNPDLAGKMRAVIIRDSFSFFSGHASNSMATTVLIYLITRPFFKYGYLFFVFPLVFAYSRIYLGLHFPLDIICGYAFGALSALGAFKVFEKLRTRFQ
jgi:undecaprenyl-diphosphatase